MKKCLFGLVLWHINPCRLFNPKYTLFIYISSKYDFLYITDNSLKRHLLAKFLGQTVQFDLPIATSQGKNEPERNGNDYQMHRTQSRPLFVADMCLPACPTLNVSTTNMP